MIREIIQRTQHLKKRKIVFHKTRVRRSVNVRVEKRGKRARVIKFSLPVVVGEKKKRQRRGGVEGLEQRGEYISIINTSDKEERESEKKETERR